jgi:hypothetical protein
MLTARITSRAGWDWECLITAPARAHTDARSVTPGAPSQDANFWGIEPREVVTAWLAITDVPPDSGPVQFVRGTHTGPDLAHAETYRADNLLSRGQEIPFDPPPDPADVVTAALSPGEFMLFHVRIAHGSPPNVSSGRRIGLAIRYMATSTRSIRAGGDTAMLVRGVDAPRNFIADLPPSAHPTAEAAEAARVRSATIKTRATMVGADMERHAKVLAERARRNVPGHLGAGGSKL